MTWPKTCAFPHSLSWCHTYSEFFLGLFDADAGMILMRADHSANSAYTHATRTAVDAVYLLVLLAPPLWHVIHSRYERMALEDGWLQVNPQVLWAHGGTAHQAGLHSRPLLTAGAVVAGYGAASRRPFTGFIRGAGTFWSLLILTSCLLLTAVRWAGEFLWGLLEHGVGWWWRLVFLCLYSTTGCFVNFCLSFITLWTWVTSWSHGCLGFRWSIPERRRASSFWWRCFCGWFLFCWSLISRWVLGGDCVVLRRTCA